MRIKVKRDYILSGTTLKSVKCMQINQHQRKNTPKSKHITVNLKFKEKRSKHEMQRNTGLSLMRGVSDDVLSLLLFSGLVNWTFTSLCHRFAETLSFAEMNIALLNSTRRYIEQLNQYIYIIYIYNIYKLYIWCIYIIFIT